jgi:hypothetical protein
MTCRQVTMSSETAIAQHSLIHDSSARRRIMMVGAVVCLGLQFPGALTYSLLALGLWLIFLALGHRTALRQLWLPRFWLITLVFALASGLLLGTKDPVFARGLLSKTGLTAGVLMMARGALIFSMATWISLTLTTQDLQRFAGRLGMARLGSSTAVAFALLPQLKERLAERISPEKATTGSRLTRVHERIVQLVYHTALLAEQMSENTGNSE